MRPFSASPRYPAAAIKAHTSRTRKVLVHALPPWRPPDGGGRGGGAGGACSWVIMLAPFVDVDGDPGSTLDFSGLRSMARVPPVKASRSQQLLNPAPAVCVDQFEAARKVRRYDAGLVRRVRWKWRRIAALVPNPTVLAM